MNDERRPTPLEWLKAVFQALHDPKVLAAAVACLVGGSLLFGAAFALGGVSPNRLLATIGASLVALGGAWLVTGRFQGLDGALADLTSPLHGSALVLACGVPLVCAWYVGTSLSG